MLTTTVGRLMVNEALPPELRDYDRVLDKKTLNGVLTELQARFPEQYKRVIHELSKTGADIAFSSGTSVSLNDLEPAKAREPVLNDIRQFVSELYANRQMDDKTRNAALVKHLASKLDSLRDSTFNESLADRNNFAMAIKSGARGNSANLGTLRAADLLVADQNDRPIPIPILRNYSEGLSPGEYFATSYGTRRGIVSTKMCLSAGTRVRMADFTVKSIDTIQPGDWVLGANTKGVTFPVLVNHVFSNGLRPCYRFTFRSGRKLDTVDALNRLELTCTEDHKILSSVTKTTRTAGWTRTVSVQPLRVARFWKNPHKNNFSACTATEYVGPASIHEPRALLLGLMVGDGCTTIKGNASSTNTCSFSFSCADISLIAAVNPYLAKFNLEFSRYGKTYTHSLRDHKRYKKEWGKTGHYNPTKQWLATCIGGKYAWEKCLPADVLLWDSKSIGAVLGGLFSTDGCFVRRQNGVTVSYSTTSPKLLQQMLDIFRLRFGIYCSVRTVTTGKWRKRPMYTLLFSDIGDVRRLAERIELVGVKRQKLIALLAETANMATYPRTSRAIEKTFVGALDTFDIEVDHADHLFVLENGLIVSNSTAEAGYLGKLLSNAASRLLVNDDAPLPDTGLPVPTDDNDNVGAVLARDYGKFKAGTVITPSVLRALRDSHDEILIHSPISAGGRGVPRLAAGVRERGMASIGDNVGVAAAQAVSEPLSQAQLSSKHGAGVLGASRESSVSGFKAVEQLVSIPSTFRNAATLANLDGRVQSITPAPQGGTFIVINNQSHYVPPDAELRTKVGDEVEAGDVLSDGIPNPAEIVKHKHIGEGRRYFVEALQKSLRSNGVNVNRRNIELLARGLINHVRISDFDVTDSALPDDIVAYDELASNWVPRAGVTQLKPDRAVGRYLETPVMHYSVGTRITPRVANSLKKHNIAMINTHVDPLPFEPHMTRALESSLHDKDWFRRLQGFYIGKGFMDSARRSSTSEIHGTNFGHALAVGVDFGKDLGTKAVY